MTDDLTGVQYVFVYYRFPNDTGTKSIILYYNSTTGKYEGTFNVDQYDAEGEYKIRQIYVSDKQDNHYNYFNEKSTYKSPTSEYRDLSNYSITIGSSDQISPVTKIVLQSSSPKVNEWYSSDINVSLNATDDQSGVDKTLYKINNGDWSQYTNSFELPNEGINTIEYKSIDKAGNEEAIKTEVVKIDKTEPVTAASDVPANWTSKDVSITVSTTDENSGIAKTEYRINNDDWTEYNGPINSLTEGKNVVDYRSIDNAGNVEETKSIEVKIDKTAPTLNVSFDQSVITDKNHQLVPINASVEADDNLSGVASYELVSIVSNQQDNGKGSGNTTQDIQGAEFGTSDLNFLVRAERSDSGDRVYTVTYKATDNAGNTVTTSQDIVVKHDNSKK